MGHTVTFKLNKPAKTFQGGESTGFGFGGGVKFYARDTKSDEWTNYECAIFAKSQAQIDYYMKNLVEGASVTVSGKTLAIRNWQRKNGDGQSIVINDAYIEYIAPPAIVRDPQAAQQRASQQF